MWKARVSAASLMALLALGSTPASAAASYTLDAYWSSGSGGTFVNQPDACSCVAASAQSWLNKIDATQYQSASTVWRRFAWARPYTQYICRLYNADGSVKSGGVLTASYGTYQPTATGYTRYRYSIHNPGLDPRALAWLMYQFTPAGYHFNDYWLNAANDGSLGQAQRDLDVSMVKNLRVTHRPVAAIVHGGNHAVLVTGFQSDYDPLTYNYRLLGFYVWDPYANVLGRNYGTGYLGQTFFYLADWKANQFTPYHDAQYTRDTGRYVIWEKDPRSGGPSYVTVFQTSDTSTSVPGPPTDSPPNSIGFARWTGKSPVVAGVPAAVTDSPIGTSAGVSGADVSRLRPFGLGRGQLIAEELLPGHPPDQLEAAVYDDVAMAGLDRQTPLGDLRGVTVGRRLHVRSTASDHSSYWLVSLEHAGVRVAVAAVDETAAGLRLGSVTAVGPDYRFPDSAAVVSADAEGGHVLAAEALYPATSSYRSELQPAWAVTDSTGHTTIVDSNGLAAGEGTDRWAPGAN